MLIKRLGGIVILIMTGLMTMGQPKNEVNPNGYNVFYYDNGQKSSEGTMKNGKPEGYWKTYYENGELKSEGNRKNFVLDSIWKFYNDLGVLLTKITYKNDKKNGYTFFYNKEGFLKAKENLKDNIKHGLAYSFYLPNGEIRDKTPFVKGKKEGRGYEYAKDGRIITIVDYRGGFVQRKEQINRKNKQGKRTGMWKFFWADEEEGLVQLEGRYSNGKKNGYFREYDKQGTLLSTTKFENGEVVSEVEELENLEIITTFYPNAKIKTVGSYKDGLQQGVTREYSQDGKIINSWLYKRGILLGEGILNAEGIKQGYWKEYYTDGKLRAEGEYKDGLRFGGWKFYHPNEKLAQNGNYTKGENPHGLWIWYYDNDSIRRKENFRKGLEDGPMVEYSDSGTVLTRGEYLDGEEEGAWFYELGDHREEGSYISGKREGIWKHYYGNGQLNFEGEYVDGEAIGKHVYYYINGKKMLDGKYEYGKKEGEWRRYDENGIILLSIRYKNGIERKVDGVRIKPPHSTKVAQ